MGKARLKDAVLAVLAAVGRSAADIVEEIVRRLNAFRGSVRPEDDVTLVVMKIHSFGIGSDDAAKRIDAQE